MIDGLPKGWAYKKLRFVGRFLSSGIDKKIVDGDPLVKMINYTDIYGNKTLKLDNSREFMEVSCPAPKQKSCQVHYGDLIFTPSSETIEDIGVSALVDEHLTDTVFSYHVLRFTFTEKVYHEFKKYLCNNDWVLSEFSRVAKGTTRQILNRNDFNSIRVILPPFQEQVRIADFLDQKTSEIDELISAKEKLLKLLEEKKVSIITRAVTKGLDPEVKMKYSGIDWLGDIPEHWRVGRLKDYVLCNMESLSENSEPDYEIEYVDISSVNFTEGISNKELITFEKAPSRARRIVRKGDVIISTVRTYLKAIARIEQKDESCIVSTGFAVLTPKSMLDSKYLYIYVRSKNMIDAIMANSVGVSYPAISPTRLISLTIPVPPLDEQLNIVKDIELKLIYMKNLEATIIKAIVKLKEYRISIITAAVTGRMDLNKLKQEHQDEKTH